MSHYFTPGGSDDVRAVAERHWVQALSGLPGWAVREALDETARESKTRPTPAVVRERASEKVAAYARELSARREIGEEASVEPPSPEAVERVRAMLRSSGLALKTVLREPKDVDVHKATGGDHED